MGDINNKLVGYVINTWNPLNFQIALNLSSKYDDLIHNDPYIYNDTPIWVNGNLIPTLYTGPKFPDKEGKVYRCRIKNLKLINDKGLKYHQLVDDLVNQINKQNGWVICKPFHIDHYKRLIVELYDPVSFHNFNNIIYNEKTKDIVEKYS